MTDASPKKSTGPALSEEQHSWLFAFTGIDTKAGALLGGVAKNVGEMASGAVSAISQAVAPTPEPQPLSASTPAPPSAPTPGPVGAPESPGLLGKLAGAASSVLDMANAAGNAITNAESVAWDGAKSAYKTVTGAYDSIAPDPVGDNRALGKGVDSLEKTLKATNDKAAAEYASVPVLGTLAKGAAAMNNAVTSAAGGVLKGVGDLVSGAENTLVHPIDAALGLGEMALGAAEHAPLLPGVNTATKAVHGVVDIARGKTDGVYGANLRELGDNLLHNTQNDPDHPGEKVNTDVAFVASFGGGMKAWSDNPIDAAARTVTVLGAPALGEELLQSGPVEEPPPPKVADSVGDPPSQTPSDVPAREPAPSSGETSEGASGTSQAVENGGAGGPPETRSNAAPDDAPPNNNVDDVLAFEARQAAFEAGKKMETGAATAHAQGEPLPAPRGEQLDNIAANTPEGATLRRAYSVKQGTEASTALQENILERSEGAAARSKENPNFGPASGRLVPEIGFQNGDVIHVNEPPGGAPAGSRTVDIGVTREPLPPSQWPDLVDQRGGQALSRGVDLKVGGGYVKDKPGFRQESGGVNPEEIRPFTPGLEP